MAKVAPRTFLPDYAIPPGETLEGELQAIGMTQTQLARRMGRPQKTINEIIHGKAAITSETAIQLERVLGVPASLWGNLERRYRDALARIAEAESLEEATERLDEFPIREMKKRGWLPNVRDKTTLLSALLAFFGVASPESLEALPSSPQFAYAFRETHIPNYATWTRMAWLRAGEAAAQGMDCAHYSQNAFKVAMSEARGFTRWQPSRFWDPLCKSFASAGVAVVFVEQFKGMGLFGATSWLSPTRAIIQTNSHYKANDNFWFSFFHECGHILLHGKRGRFLEMEQDGPQEEEADRFAEDFLLPPRHYAKFCEQGTFSEREVRRFALEMGVAPAIVCGRLKKDRLVPHSHLNGLKEKLDWATVVDAQAVTS